MTVWLSSNRSASHSGSQGGPFQEKRIMTQRMKNAAMITRVLNRCVLGTAVRGHVAPLWPRLPPRPPLGPSAFPALSAATRWPVPACRNPPRSWRRIRR
jgi:hypothetical protein